ncbi:MAG TPA: hypothetical protein VGT05_01440 [Patescibacteria group bacterium]|nr:hypothetical protein [Patescibacteria group bacterium]
MPGELALSVTSPLSPPTSHKTGFAYSVDAAPIPPLFRKNPHFIQKNHHPVLDEVLGGKDLHRVPQKLAETNIFEAHLRPITDGSVEIYPYELPVQLGAPAIKHFQTEHYMADSFDRLANEIYGNRYGGKIKFQDLNGEEQRVVMEAGNRFLARQQGRETIETPDTPRNDQERAQAIDHTIETLRAPYRQREEIFGQYEVPLSNLPYLDPRPSGRGME